MNEKSIGSINKINHQVEILRPRRGCRDNIVGYIPYITGCNREDVINSPQVRELINNTYGKSFTVNIYSSNKTNYYQYSIKKTKAIQY